MVPLAKKELLYYTGTVGLALFFLGTVFINRMQSDDTKHILEKTKEKMKSSNVSFKLHDSLSDCVNQSRGDL